MNKRRFYETVLPGAGMGWVMPDLFPFHEALVASLLFGIWWALFLEMTEPKR